VACRPVAAPTLAPWREVAERRRREAQQQQQAAQSAMAASLHQQHAHHQSSSLSHSTLRRGPPALIPSLVRRAGGAFPPAGGGRAASTSPAAPTGHRRLHSIPMQGLRSPRRRAVSMPADIALSGGGIHGVLNPRPTSPSAASSSSSSSGRFASDDRSGAGSAAGSAVAAGGETSGGERAMQGRKGHAMHPGRQRHPNASFSDGRSNHHHHHHHMDTASAETLEIASPSRRLVDSPRSGDGEPRRLASEGSTAPRVTVGPGQPAADAAVSPLTPQTGTGGVPAASAPAGVAAPNDLWTAPALHSAGCRAVLPASTRQAVVEFGDVWGVLVARIASLVEM
jgi:hypothetical protein